MDEKVLVLFVLPLAALALILGWFVIMSRGGKPLALSLKGFGVSIELDAGTTEQVNNQKEST